MTDEDGRQMAEMIRSQRRALSDEAMSRIERGMADEMDAAQRRAGRVRFLRWSGVFATAAAVVIGVGVYLHRRPPAELPPGPVHRSAAVAVDSFTVQFHRPPASLGDGPLVCLDRYESLYTDRE